MIRRNRKTRNYQAPSAKVTQMELERSFCKSVIVNTRFLEVEELDNMNDATTNPDFAAEYFEDIIS